MTLVRLLSVNPIYTKTKMNSCFWENKVNTEEGFFVCTRNSKNYGNRNSLTGYHGITLKTLSGEYESMGIHRAIWMAANRQRIQKGMHICHRNDDPSDNRISNLYCDTPKNNVLASIKNRSKTRKRFGHKTKVRAVFESGNTKDYTSMTAAAKELGVSRPVIGKILSDDPVNKYYHYAYDDQKNKYKFVRVK